jgi:predicted transcriptional regulator
MSASSLDIELSKYWSLLTPAQKQSLISLIKSFAQSPVRASLEQYNQELAEAEAEYQAGDYITHEEMLKLIHKWQ